MVELFVKAVGQKELEEAFRRSREGMKPLLERLGWLSAMAMKRELQLAYSTGPLFSRSASAGLEGSVEAFSRVRGSFVDAGAGTRKGWADTHERGAIIFPRVARVLHFVTREGEEVFTRGPVRIPARKPGEAAAHRAEPYVRKVWANGLGRLAVLGGPGAR